MHSSRIVPTKAGLIRSSGHNPVYVCGKCSWLFLRTVLRTVKSHSASSGVYVILYVLWCLCPVRVYVMWCCASLCVVVCMSSGAVVSMSSGAVVSMSCAWLSGACLCCMFQFLVQSVYIVTDNNT